MVNRRKGGQTRRRLLEVAFGVMCRRGFQAAGLSEILEAAGLTKGAMYHHFRDKTALGYAVVEEIVAELIVERWIAPLGAEGEPLEVIAKSMRGAAGGVSEREIALGCPLANLGAEMSGLDDGFAGRIDAIYQKWRDALAAMLTGVADDPQRIASFIVSTLTGCLAQAKLLASGDVLLAGVAELEFYLRHLQQLAAEPPKPKYASPPQTEMEDYLL